jgi:hypothetical protein
VGAAWRAELGREGREERLDDGELQRRQQQHPAADVGPCRPDVPPPRRASPKKTWTRSLVTNQIIFILCKPIYIGSQTII